ncbi:MAG TPA: MtrB/PioB family decaheme-associated outer membrane protein [Rhodocyclaceae bacterium]
MKANNRKLAVSLMALSVQGALAAMAMMPQAALAEGDEDVAALTNPTNYVEIGVTNNSAKSAKFGEYNGLPDKGADLLGNFSVKGGDSYGQNTGTRRWSLYGNDVGTTSRELGASVGDQGKWNVGIDFDQLRHNISDTYKTPLQGSVGGNTFNLPASFGVINTSTAPATAAGTLGLTAAQKAAFQQQDIYSERKNTSFSAGFNFSPEWNVKFDYKRIDQSGAKLMAAGTDILGYVAGTTLAAWGAEKTLILPNPTSYKTDNVTLALNYVGEKGNFSAEYYGSLFHDDYTGVNFPNPFNGDQKKSGTLAAFTSTVLQPTGANIGAFPIDSMSTPPDNQFHQLDFKGGYLFSPATRFTGGLAYSRNTQNDTFTGTYTPGMVGVLPANSLNALVVNKHLDLRLSHQATKGLNLAAAYKFNERDNRTASSVYQFFDLGTAPNKGSAPTSVLNAPMSNKRQQFELAADYRIDPRQTLHGAYEYEKIQRWCDNSLANTRQGAVPADGSATPVNSSCAQVPEEKENRLGLLYRIRATDSVAVNAGYTYARRKSDLNQSFYNPMQANGEGYEDRGFVAFFQASRAENLFKAGVNWQATDQLSLGVSGKYGKDDYKDETFGVTKGTTASLNLDAAYNYSEDNSVSAYGTIQHRTRDMTNANGRLAGSIATTNWSNNLADQDLTVGISAKQKSLLGGKLELSEDLTYQNSRTMYNTTLGAGIAPGANFSNYGSFPQLTNEITSFKVAGAYKLDKASSILAGYLYQHLNISDVTYYSLYNDALKSGILPTYQQPGSYSQNMVYAAYRYSFK